MKKLYLLALSALSLCLASCYEIEDLEQAYKEQYKQTEISEIEFATNFVDQITFMRLHFSVTHYKNDCTLTLHYTDVEGADPFQTGNTNDITSLLSDPNNGTVFGIHCELGNLMPETRYWAGISYRDPGCETLRSKVVNFTTEGIERGSDCYDYGSDYRGVRAKFERVPMGSTYGCLIGTETNLTLDHCLESRVVGTHTIGDNEEIFRERFEGLQPGITYYYRSYVTYRGRTYYSRVNELYRW